MQNTHTHTHTRHQKAYEQRHEERDCVSKIHFRFNVFVCCLLIFVRNAQSIIKCQEITLTGIIYLSTQPHTIEMKYDDVDAHELQLTVQKKNCSSTYIHRSPTCKHWRFRIRKQIAFRVSTRWPVYS